MPISRSRHVIAGCAAALALAGCGDAGDEEAVDDDDTFADPGEIDDVDLDRVAEELLLRPEQIGEEVAVAGEVTGARGSYFWLETPRAPDEGTILVVHPLEEPPGDDTIVRVSGVVRDANATHLEEELEVDLPDQEFERYRDDIAIAATAIDE